MNIQEYREMSATLSFSLNAPASIQHEDLVILHSALGLVAEASKARELLAFIQMSKEEAFINDLQEVLSRFCWYLAEFCGLLNISFKRLWEKHKNNDARFTNEAEPYELLRLSGDIAKYSKEIVFCESDEYKLVILTLGKCVWTIQAICLKHDLNPKSVKLNETVKDKGVA